MKTPEEIKRGLECCAIRKNCAECPYKDGKLSEECMDTLEAEALAYIRQLEMLAKPNEQIRWERDVAVDQLRQLGIGFGEKVDAQVTKWIGVEERLPEDDVDVLVYIASKKENVDSVTAITYYTHSMYGYNIEGWCSPRQYCFWDREVTHWMPLPEPPKEGNA